MITADNAADLISRGMRVEHLIGSELWWHRPPWLVRDQSKWPIGQMLTNDELQAEVQTGCKAPTVKLKVFAITINIASGDINLLESKSSIKKRSWRYSLRAEIL